MLASIKAARSKMCNKLERSGHLLMLLCMRVCFIVVDCILRKSGPNKRILQLGTDSNVQIPEKRAILACKRWKASAVSFQDIVVSGKRKAEMLTSPRDSLLLLYRFRCRIAGQWGTE